MPIDFEKGRWEKIREDYARWWAGELKRPLIHMTLYNADPGRPEPAIPSQDFTTNFKWSVTPEQIVDRWDYNMSTNRFLGDSFPANWPNFGAGVAAGFLGAEVTPAEDTVWFKPKQLKPIKEVSFRKTPKNRWYKRVESICRAAMERWQGQVQIGMTDLGGNLDILSTFRPSESLLLDLYDNPAEVKRLTWEEHDAWWFYFNELNKVLQPVNPGYTTWTPIYSAKPYYMLQCDFCYMIGPDMFDEFVKPELAATCKLLGNAFYHLDGPGQLVHLDSLLTIKELKGVQWVPGAGNPGTTEWPQVYRKIRDAGKLMQIVSGGMQALDTIAGQLGSAEGIIIFCGADVKDKTSADDFLRRYKAI